MSISTACGSLDKTNRLSMFQYQAPATLNQANPTQNQWYDILPTTANVKIYQIAIQVATTNETLEAQIIIDGETITATALAPATAGTSYTAYIVAEAVNRVDLLTFGTGNPNLAPKGLPIEGHSVQVQVRKTTAAGAGNLTGIVLYGILTST